ncbi:MAG: PCMD domain-containing protein [Bacteroides sp.]|nr:PCMD domain-containing protein [Bacteroides sp.]MCM1412745.1 PCMD domain-containing protein [Bacteroides sp.]MCM1470961.1 PCMD domain-containing protein [Bacteroides sp.]
MYTSKYFSKTFAGIAIAFAALLSACISNDLPYPYEFPSTASIEIKATDADGHDILDGPVVIDSTSRTITLNLSEYANIRSIVVESISFTDGSKCLDPEVFDTPLNLTEPVEFELQKYDHITTWTIIANQPIERYFTVASQIGSSQIDPINHTVKVMVPMQQPLNNIAVRSLKLAGPLADYDPELAGTHADFSQPVTVSVSEFGYDTPWTITIEQTEISVDLTRVDAWTNVAWLYGTAEEGKTNGFEYRRADAPDDTWIVVPDEWITHDGGSFTARLIHLESQTAYIARATSDDENSVEVEFTTGEIVQLPNSDFTQWYKDGKIWNPWTEGGTSFWSTGNRGATTLGQSNTVPIENPASSTGYLGARLETKFVGVSILGKLAAGNLFSGDFKKIDGTNGILDFGRQFSQRPTKLKARLKYTTATITDASSSNPNFSHMKGQPDTCIVWCTLADWDTPFEIRTKPEERHLFSRNDPGVIAYGQFESGSTIADYIDVEIPLEYVATDRVPKYIIVCASASKYGDYFTGGRGATLCITNYELLYDY